MRQICVGSWGLAGIRDALIAPQGLIGVSGTRVIE